MKTFPVIAAIAMVVAFAALDAPLWATMTLPWIWAAAMDYITEPRK